MSGSIKLKHASGNGVTISAPSSNPAADRTLTLPSDADGIIAKTDTSGNLNFADGKKINLGDSSDLQIQHNGSVNIIDSANNATLKFQRGGSDVWELKSTGLQGIDNQKLILGTSDDLALYHDGNHSYIQDSGTGDLTLLASRTLIGSSDNTEVCASFTENGAVELMFDNSKKFETTNTGGHFTGKFTFNDGSSNQIAFGDSEDLQIFHDGSDSFIKDTGTGGIRIDSSQTVIRNESGSARLEVSSDGQINHRYDTSTNPKQIYHWSNNRTGMSFRSANTERGNIFFFDSGVQFNTSSDYRLKENVTSISDGITRVKQLIPRKFNWIIDESNTPVDGFLAHEVSSIVPEAVNGTKDAVATQEDVDSGRSQKVGDPIHQMIDHSKLVPLLAAGLKEAISEIEILKTKVATLEGG